MCLWFCRPRVILEDEWGVAHLYIAGAKQLFLVVGTQAMIIELTSKWLLSYNNSEITGKSLKEM